MSKKVLVVGLGSMGKRRIHLMQQTYPSLEIIGVDAKKGRRIEAENLLGISTFSYFQEAAQGAECALDSTSPLSHQNCPCNLWSLDSILSPS